ncbi:glycosyltransferase [Calothrix sp. PCC 6303]|uniref:glycosyltransferase n=1 Tax=Calothrix sp. PCC 6303 TaxID=1170562 RepID=UPI0002A024E6|nr:glycosyltransferase [Calothrix sp. PCC 6303]AFZ02043.1 glycosyl transferase family 2 [Calothrix sp. PCC 6303]
MPSYMQPILSVVICTHNPNTNYLTRVLEALKEQTLKLELWEILLIDNASSQQLSLEIDLSWHPQSRHIREDKLGLTPARLRGIKEAVGEVLVFVDDDNVLDFDYLKLAVEISQDFPKLGAWGGQVQAEFEEPPPEWTKPYWGFLAIREFTTDKWSNLLHQHETVPCGAGMCVRRVVADKYADLVSHDPRRINLDRKGTLLTSCGDSDLAFTACDVGLGTGLFTYLKLIHLIPHTRLKEDYILRLLEGICYSRTILDFLRGKPIPKYSWKDRLLEYYFILRLNPRERRLYMAQKRGNFLALKELLKLSSISR